MAETLAEKKQRCKEFIAKKDEIEKEMDALFEYFGRSDVKAFKVIDEDGYPNTDSGMIYEVRTNKNRLEVLKTDHKNIIADIETLLGEIHGMQKAAKAPSSSNTAKECGTTCTPKASAFDVSTLALRLAVDEVMEGSPAAAGGLKPGDIIIKYGSVDVSMYMAEDKSYLLEDVNSVTRSSVGRSIRVEALRGTEMPILSVVPAKWSGPGVLGCHFTVSP